MHTFACAALMALACSSCSGAEEQDVFSGASSSSSSGQGGASSSSSSSSSGSGGSSGTGSSSSGSSSSGGSSGDPTGVSDGGAPCAREREPNDQAGQANTLETSVCGSLSPTSELDYLTFTLPAGTQGMNLTFQGNIRMRISVQGTKVEVTPADNPDIPFVLGHPYVIQISRYRDDANVPWRVNLAKP